MATDLEELRAAATATDRKAIGRELLCLVLGVEGRGQFANALCWLLMVAAAATLNDPTPFIIPLIARMLASPVTHLAFRRARRLIAEGASNRKAMTAVAAALFFGGASWGAVMPPLLSISLNEPAAILIFGSLVCGITIIISMLAPVRMLALTYAAGFQVTLCVLLAINPVGYGWQALLAIDSMFLIFLAYGYATTNRQLDTAKTLVANRNLTKILGETLREMEKLAFVDTLTGLMNRRSFFLFAEKLDPRKVRHVLTLDLDHFKSINDTYGHAVGDEVLVAVGKTLHGIVSDLPGTGHCVARMGGEEFAIILSLEDPAAVETFAEMLRLAVFGVSTQIGRRGLVTSASIGISRWRASETLDDAISRADEATYRAKADGRNRVMLAAA